MLDPAVNAVRDDLADVELADRVFAPHYAEAVSCTLVAKSELKKKPNTEAEVVGQLKADSTIDLFDISGGWAWVRASVGIGYVPADCLRLG